MLKTTDLDEKEKIIIRELIRNPRISDNQLAKKTRVPVKTVNRKRKSLESRNLLRYYAHLNNSKGGTRSFTAEQLLIISFRRGISRHKFMQAMIGQDAEMMSLKHVSDMYLSETNGRLALITTLKSRLASDFVEILNEVFIPHLNRVLGANAVADTKTFTLSAPLILLHNYLPDKNMLNGIIRPDWPDDKIFVI